MSNSTKAMLQSWFNVFIAAVITAVIVVIGDGKITLDDLWYVIVAGLVAVLPVVKNYFDKQDPRYGKVDSEKESSSE